MKATLRNQLRRSLSPQARARLGRSFQPLRKYESVFPRTLVTSPSQAMHGGFTARRLNGLANLLPTCSTYLEVGVFRGTTLEAVEVPFRAGVDPAPLFDIGHLPPGLRIFTSDSDSFFSHLDPRVKFDLIYLDGLHEWRQTLRDLANSLQHSPDHSLILLDDVQPTNAVSSLPDMDAALALQGAQGSETESWQGDVYKVLIYVQRFVPGLRFVVLSEPGCNNQAVIWRVEKGVRIDEDLQYPEAIDALTYDDVFPGGVTPAGFRPVRETDLIDILVAEGFPSWRRDATE